jgi:hypothetical protein
MRKFDWRFDREDIEMGRYAPNEKEIGLHVPFHVPAFSY